MFDLRFVVFAVIFGGQYSTIAQIARLLTAFYLAYIGKSNDLLPESIRELCKFLSLIYFSIVIVASIINTCDYLFG